MSLNIDIIKKYLKEHPNMGDTKLAKLIAKDKLLGDPEDYAVYNQVRTRIQRVKKSVETPDKEDKPRVTKQVYHWETIYGKIEFPVSQVDELFYEYSKHGLNMSQTSIINKHGLEGWQWQSIKRKLQLVKDANIFSPYTVNKYEGKTLDEMINEKISRKYKSKGTLVEKAYEQQTFKAYKKVIDAGERLNLEKDIFYNEILRMLPLAEVNVTIPVTKKTGLVKEVVVTLADLHNGARVEKIQNTLTFNPRILEGYLDEIAEELNKKNYKAVNLAFLGDLIESFTGLNHKNSWKGIEYSYYGSTVVIKTIELLTRFISKVKNVKRIIGINGNHDRSTSDNKEDTKGEIGTIIFFMLKQVYSNTKIEVIHDEDVVSINIDGINYIFTHGHLPEFKKGADKIINNYGDNKFFNLILAGHLHSRLVLDDSWNHRFIHVPSLFTGNLYSKQLGFSSTAGFLEIYNRKDGKPKVDDTTL